MKPPVAVEANETKRVCAYYFDSKVHAGERCLCSREFIRQAIH
jgi:hypothetical protein